MNSIHGHEVLHIMEGKDYTDESLLTAIQQKFGHNARFHTCSQHNMTASELIEFLKRRGKFKPTHNAEFTVDRTKICNH